MSKESIKLIVLDIDGVLNSEKYSTSLGNAWDGNQIDPLAVARLNRLTDIIRARLVVSSSWWLDYPNLQDLLRVLEASGVTGEVIGMTPYLNTKRSSEILEWLNNNCNVYNIESFVILDDDKLEPSGETFTPTLYAAPIAERSAPSHVRNARNNKEVIVE